jgi:alpha-galactosidase
MLIRLCSLVVVTFVMTSPVVAQNKLLAVTPPMGWNSWDSYGLTITESQFRANVDVMAKKLKASGYQYAVVDEGWYLANPQKEKAATFVYRMDANGRYIPAQNRFVSSAGAAGFKPIADYVHEQGLKFGIHIIRGIPKEAVTANLPIAGSAFHATDASDMTDKCPWNPDNWGVKDNAAGQAWYDSLMKQYADWGIDYIKVDCIAAKPYKGDEIRMIHRAIVKTGRPIVLSLSPGPTALENVAEVGQNAQLWRISNDVWDHWERGKEWSQSVKDQFEVIANWAKYAKPGNWPDADMLPLGMLEPVPGDGKPRATRLTHDEQRTLITLWAMARSPLFIGANLTELDDWTLGLLTNSKVIEIDQHSTDVQVGQNGNIIAWSAMGEAGKTYVALFNVGETVATSKDFEGFAVNSRVQTVRDLWAGGTEASVSDMQIPPHGCILLELSILRVQEKSAK